MASVLVIGSGGRESAISWSLSRSPSVGRVYVAPGNGGSDAHKVERVRNLDVQDFAKVTRFCKDKNVTLVVVGPEVPLVEGMADELARERIKCFGPSKMAARLEGSKAFSKDFMVRNGIPTADHRNFQGEKEYSAALTYVREATKHHKVVVKASGLAAGKGVLLPETCDEAVHAIKTIMVDNAFGKEAGEEVVVEEFMEGPEVSVFAFCDGTNIHLLPPSQDHKRIFEGDKGPNTGGMGAYCPAKVLTPEMQEMVKVEIVQKTIDAAKKEGFPFVGLLYTGLMLTSSGPKVLEYNCRFGDPETQAVLLLLQSDLYAIMNACASHNLASAGEIRFYEGMFAATVVAASEGYPGAYPKGREILGIDRAESESGSTLVKVFQAGTKMGDDGNTYTSGGRVLVVSARATTLKKALDAAYAGLRKISFEGMQYRKDIGHQQLEDGCSVQAIVNQVRSVLEDEKNVPYLVGAAAVLITGVGMLLRKK
mmetsp:Transcript_17837/g.28894  ORF Transcript_17837/g.28894 Transcript_17837/m.28894 type:complete len:481 (+) Transcript_17837:25-1467(+)|eukprot:CAMPEP_0203745782 /NCGR_PEP_ID=MMETSP0098-20131031/1414_1 /ASSEMBLY_ACC=CAM_ASM_000208 /TAXON_ID=96639 /ORGANISM=" , Strain NY0313808BC1" /LENGTH=480 /DNA_ID=CAMNT_0050633665 /DNA_START=62 /DNA_END=1504 /DNA_ORIENTATION=+